MAGPTDLTRAAYAGKETKLYANIGGTYASPTWVEITRARNVQRNRGPALSDIEFHGAEETGAVPGYRAMKGSFEYARMRGTDTVWAALEAARDAGDIVDLAHLNGPITSSASKGWRCPVLLGETSGSANGNDGVIDTIPFSKADCNLVSDGSAVNYVAFSGTDPE
ncbi:hypothetical protein RMSM_03985 [Rhodopirellula maiorica SM1]|uniref:Uncharacterized protein n=1 Tax=Rhodopirellula maiorica SM1 TaxID=1265738 RepID=M5RYT2_9BACT|nr:hypothetical protein [Rhodopirellula maiorica]EMI19089.1 hypothetical protein RMSM_03985 [Rhodopirellula maiorica SM1]